MSEIYADVYFFINFAMDFICLYITSLISSRKTSIFRLALGGFFGGAYSIFALLLLNGRSGVIITLFAALLICFCTFFNGKDLKGIFPSFLVFTAVSFFMGGALTYIYSYLGRLFGGVQAGNSRSFLLLPASALCALFSFITSRISKKAFKGHRVGIKIITSRTLEFSALVDSGNLLHDPISGLPVIILSKKASLNFVKSGIFTPSEVIKYPEVSKKIRLIPFKSAWASKDGEKGEESSILTSFIPEGGVAVSGIKRECCVAFSHSESFSGADALLPASLFGDI